MEEQPAQPEQSFEKKQFYLPGDLGLDPSNRKDMILYVESNGDAVLAGYMLEQRRAQNDYDTARINDEQYQERQTELNGFIVERWRALGLPMPRTLDHKEL